MESAGDWNDPARSRLWLYNLHYFDDLLAGDGPSRRQWHEALIQRWIEENPAGTGSGWEPYPLSQRIVNWIKWALNGNSLTAAALDSLAAQARFLRKRIEYHLLGNHLLANGKALLFAGLFFEGAEAEKWLRKGADIVSTQLPEQVLPDGGHFERSPMYHAIVTEDLLDMINLMRAYGRRVPEVFEEAAERMLGWLATMTHPDGGVALFNDAAFGIASTPADLFAYGARLGVALPGNSSGPVRHLKSSGYIRVEAEDAVAFLDVAPLGPDYLPGHGHADTLTFELSLFGRRFIVDSGTSCYGLGDERLRQRGTAAHNTVTINGEDSSEVWAGFRVARRATPKDVEVTASDGEIVVSASHNGYDRLPGRPRHMRNWVFGENSLRIRDEIRGPFQEAVARFHLHPDLKVESGEGRSAGVIAMPGGESVSWEASGGRYFFEESTYHPEFGLSISNRCLVVRFDSNEAELLLRW
ncbi:MAG: heparinase II/III family protein [Desulfobulbaceae bacterium]